MNLQSKSFRPSIGPTEEKLKNISDDKKVAKSQGCQEEEEFLLSSLSLSLSQRG
jgi:hypothetical protein